MVAESPQASLLAPLPSLPSQPLLSSHSSLAGAVPFPPQPRTSNPGSALAATPSAARASPAPPPAGNRRASVDGGLSATSSLPGGDLPAGSSLLSHGSAAAVAAAASGGGPLQPPSLGRGRSQFRGVSWHVVNNRYIARIRTNTGGNTHLGCFDSAHEAAQAYDVAAIALRGPHQAITNFPAAQYLTEHVRALGCACLGPASARARGALEAGGVLRAPRLRSSEGDASRLFALKERNESNRKFRPLYLQGILKPELLELLAKASTPIVPVAMGGQLRRRSTSTSGAPPTAPLLPAGAGAPHPRTSSGGGARLSNSGAGPSRRESASGGRAAASAFANEGAGGSHAVVHVPAVVVTARDVSPVAFSPSTAAAAATRLPSPRRATAAAVAAAQAQRAGAGAVAGGQRGAEDPDRAAAAALMDLVRTEQQALAEAAAAAVAAAQRVLPH